MQEDYRGAGALIGNLKTKPVRLDARHQAFVALPPMISASYSGIVDMTQRW